MINEFGKVARYKVIKIKSNIFPYSKKVEKAFLKLYNVGTSLVVQGLRLRTSNARGAGLIPGPGTKIPHAPWHDQKIKNKNKIKLYNV